MANWVINHMIIFGDNKDLIKFKDDVAGGESDFSFKKIVPQPKDTSAWAEDGYPGWHIWRLEHWGTKLDAWDVNLSNEGNHLFYDFVTVWDPPFPIYYTLIETYTDLDFQIFVSDAANRATYELEAKRGNYTRMIYNYDDSVPWRNNQRKILHYRKDVLKNTLQVIKEDIFDPPKINYNSDADHLLEELEDF